MYKNHHSKTSVLAADEARILLNSIDTSTVMGLRDRALIALMAYTFVHVSTVRMLFWSAVITMGSWRRR